jgi:hypothetical protein
MPGNAKSHFPRFSRHMADRPRNHDALPAPLFFFPCRWRRGPPYLLLTGDDTFGLNTSRPFRVVTAEPDSKREMTRTDATLIQMGENVIPFSSSHASFAGVALRPAPPSKPRRRSGENSWHRLARSPTDRLTLADQSIAGNGGVWRKALPPRRLSPFVFFLPSQNSPGGWISPSPIISRARAAISIKLLTIVVHPLLHLSV